MSRRIVIDSGPLVALFNKGDKYCVPALSFLQKNRSPLYTTLPVITEVVFLLDFSLEAQGDFLEWIHRGGLSIVNLESHDFARIRELMAKYRDLPMDFADGSLVVVCEKLKSPFIATLDSDFEIYRYFGRKRFQNVFIN